MYSRTILTIEAQTGVVSSLLEERLMEPVLGAVYEADLYKEEDRVFSFVPDMDPANSPAPMFRLLLFAAR